MGVHRIRLTAAWKPAEGVLNSWERVFHAPTGLGPQTQVRLCLRLSELPKAVMLNGTPLEVDVGNRGESPVVSNVENQRMSWRVEGLLTPVNRLVVSFAGETSSSVPPPFGPADDARPRHVTKVLECSLEIDEDGF